MEAKRAFLLVAVLVACLEIVCVEGRPLWPKNKELMINTLEANSKRELGEQHSPSTPPNHIASPMTPHGTLSFGDSISGTHAAYRDDLRPTAPGSNHGVGHKLTQSRENMDLEKAKKFVTTGTKDDYQPTVPGYSPSVGHKLTKSREHMELEKDRKFVTAGTKDDYKPTGPGHSPGVGHGFQLVDKPSP